ncbi:TonB-dependent siderophore receptor [Thalassobaculum salexigens]|uniref:TonB-dependent siderophore receptor n=1 Tax=Thalassobaculum salexigens TaxID=455360 RepID=UPI00248D9AA4|nr:TonB-dependent siderophore receptor [Thalassobaculum salexigens]
MRLRDGSPALTGAANGANRRGTRTALHGAIAAGVASLIATSALAEATVDQVTVDQAAAASSAQQLAQAEAKRFDIAAKSLEQALIDFGQQADFQVSFDPALTEGLTSNSLQGRFTPDAALRRLLSGLPITATFSGTNTVTLSRVTSDSSAMMLGPVVVEGEGQTATGPVDGYVATRSGSVSKTDTPIIETPRSVSVVTADAISDRKTMTVEDSLRYVPGVQVNGYGNDPRFDQIKVRGFAVTSTADFRDGLRQPNTGWLSYFHTEPYALERIDVVKGPNSVLFGQSAPGGMVNRVTKRPTADTRGEVEVQLGTDEHRQGQVDLSGPVTEDETLLYRFVGVLRESESGLMGVNNDVQFIAPSVTWKPTEKLTLTFLGEAQHFETAGSSRPYQFASGELSDFWAGDEDFDGLKQTQYIGGYEGRYEFNEIFALRQNFRYGTVETENQYLSSSMTGDGHTLSRTTYGVYEEMDNLSVDTAAEARFTTGAVRHTAMIGIDYSKIDADVQYAYGTGPSIDMLNPDYHQDVSRPGTILVDQNIDAHQLGFYANEQMEWGGWRFNGGLRHDRAEKETTNNLTGGVTEGENSATTGSAGLLYLFDSGFAPYASYATSFTPDFGTDINGDSFEPTEGEQYEIGLKYQPPGRDSIYTVSLYNLVETNVKTQDPNNIANSIQTGEQRSRGLELEAAMKLSDNIDLVAGYSYIDAEITKSNDGDEGNVPVGVAEHMASVWGNYSFIAGTLDGLELGAGARYLGETYDDSANTNTNDAVTMFDARISYDLDMLAPGASIGLTGTNLTDEEHITCEAGYCYRGRGRTVIGSLTYRW